MKIYFSQYSFPALALTFIAILSASHLFSQQTDDTDDDTTKPAKAGKGGKKEAGEPAPTGTVKALPNYQISASPDNVALTPATQPKKDIKVYGEPRNSTGHPCTLLDKQDIDDLKKTIKSNKEAQDAYAVLQKEADALVANPLQAPTAQKGPDGKWLSPSEMEGQRPHIIEATAKGSVELGMMYQLSGDQKYGEACKKILMGYADNFPNYGHPKGWTEQKWHSSHDQRLSHQFLDDGILLCKFAFAYDLVHDLPSWTPVEHTSLRDNFLRPVAAIFHNPDVGDKNYLSAQHNRSCICTSGVLIAGYAAEDDFMINEAMYGPGGTKEKPTGGLLKVHFGECLLPDGLWIEGAPGYQIGIASCGLFNDAETLWHHGIDMYRYKGGALKELLDSAIALAYPDDKMSEPKLHDSQEIMLITDIDWAKNEAPLSYELGYRRYQDPAYIPIINNATKTLTMTEHSGPPSVFQDLPPTTSVPPRAVENDNFYSVGYGVLRTPTADGSNNMLVQEYGPSGGHAHPSKLAIDLYALGEPVMPLPGVIFPYGDPLDRNWFDTTVANCLLVVDGQDQLYSKNMFGNKDAVPPVGIQIVFAPASTIGMQRASSNTIQPGITEDRSLFLTPNYLVDIFGGFDTAPHIYDLAWHVRGTMTTTLKSGAFQFPAPVPLGYNSIGDPTHASTDQAWSANVTLPKGKPVRFFAPGGTATDVIIGTGHFRNSSKEDEKPPMFMQRRTGQNSVIFANAADISGGADPYIKGVTQEGSFDSGYGLLKVNTTNGTDICFASFKPGTYSSGDFSTDGIQAFALMNGKDADALYLAGGTTLKNGGVSIARSSPGLAYVEKTASGSYIVGNASPSDAIVTVTLPALASLKAFTFDEKGQHTGPATVTKGPGANSIALTLKANTKVEFAAQ